MPYCPKCDMEFIEGVTTCTDCGGPLFESKEAAEQMKDQYLKMREEQMKKQYEQMMAAQAQAKQQQEQQAAAQAAAIEQAKAQMTPEQAERYAKMQKLAEAKAKRAATPAKEYINKERKYDDMKSSVTAFLIVGAAAAIAIIASITGIITLPFSGVMYYIVIGMLAFMAIGSFVVAFTSKKSAEVLKGEISVEENQTKELIEWFVSKYTAENIDRVIHKHLSDLTEEELSLQRFEIIQDLLITNHDLPDQSYVDALCDMIYTKLYES